MPRWSGSSRSQAVRSASQEMALAPTDVAAIVASDGDSKRAAGWEISVATSGMDKSGMAEGRIRNAILIAGPTASGKSGLALELAERHGGTIVNADSMQVYSVLRTLTARPGRRRSAAGAAPALRTCSIRARPIRRGPGCATSWRSAAAANWKPGGLIFVGGTGLYFRALVGGHFGNAGDPGHGARALARTSLRNRGRPSCTGS